MNQAQFTAADYDEHASWLIRKGKFELARLALLVRNSLREQGDTSTEPTPVGPLGPEAYLEAAAEWEAEGKHQMAAAARLRAAELRLERGDADNESRNENQN